MESNPYKGAVPPTRFLPWIAGTLIVVTALLGWIGYKNLGSSWDDRLYHTLLLYFMGGSFDPGDQIPSTVAIARLTGPLSLAVGTLWALLGLIRDSGNAFFLLFARDHLVIAVEGGDALHFAEDALKRGQKTVLIDASGNDPRIEELRRRKVIVVKGTPDQPHVLWRCRVHRADAFICFTQSDTLNIRGLVQAFDLAREFRRTPEQGQTQLQCHAKVDDPRLRAAFGEITVPRESLNKTDAYLFSLASASARRAFEDFPIEIDRKGNLSTCPEIAVIGGSPEAAAFFDQAFRIGHFATRKPLHIRWFTHRADEIEARLDGLYSGFKELVKVEIISVADSSPDSYSAAVRNESNFPRENAFTTFVCALDIESNTFIVAQQLQILLNANACRIIAQLGREPNLARLIETEGDNDIPDTCIAGGLDKISGWETIINQTRESRAQAFHQLYCEKYDGLPAWEKLSEPKRDQNRFAADHIATKLRALDFEPNRSPAEELAQKIEDNIELLAEMEHRRWCAAHFLAGYRPGEKKSEAWKTHPDLIPWEELQKRDADKDLESVRGIPKVLSTTESQSDEKTQ